MRAPDGSSPEISAEKRGSCAAGKAELTGGPCWSAGAHEAGVRCERARRAVYGAWAEHGVRRRAGGSGPSGALALSARRETGRALGSRGWKRARERGGSWAARAVRGNWLGQRAGPMREKERADWAAGKGWAGLFWVWVLFPFLFLTQTQAK